MGKSHSLNQPNFNLRFWPSHANSEYLWHFKRAEARLHNLASDNWDDSWDIYSEDDDWYQKMGCWGYLYDAKLPWSGLFGEEEGASAVRKEEQKGQEEQAVLEVELSAFRVKRLTLNGDRMSRVCSAFWLLYQLLFVSVTTVLSYIQQTFSNV